ncbi:piggyBac transposable element-derived protein 3-like isoform X1 [Metopolophium dirhodum]|uniref:piggyBac transposable element-derived protein 3-like isoform X1 n=1 Tax=Metopolophium dirhodum TaxID=44670 RepID=UPI002990790A|nr:piggyBac transposable element-derived protein 3-like isoform X1 [Metopolophium dirhodum]XP_060865566.1 piggyBac transposable element-derived protein 3-like isoform X1 [Metopolophium dirhodum]XP_060868269.1 piggyBac transposable element-derived protein 3-like isoform X1 [Metopolophium dirhodum]
MLKKQQQLPYGDIIELLGDGRDSELSSLSGDDDDFVDDNEYPRSEIEKSSKEQMFENVLDDFELFDFEDDEDFNVFGINNETVEDEYEVFNLPMHQLEQQSDNNVNETVEDEHEPLQQGEQQSDNNAYARPSTPAIPPHHIAIRPVVEHGLHLNNLPYYTKNEIKWSNRPFVSSFLKISPPAPELSTTYRTLSPIEYFSKYFPEEEFENMAKYTNIYAKQNNFINYVDTTPSEMKVFVGIHLKIGCQKPSRIRLCWTNDDRVNIIADNMSRNRFFQLRSCFHVMNNDDIPENNVDKFIKVRPLYNSFLKRCKELPVETNLAVDEQMVKFKGKLGVKQYMKGKPCPWGIKNFLLCSANGMVYNMILYQGSSTEINHEIQKKYGLGGSIVLQLVEHIDKNEHYLYFDNYFSSYNLFTSLDCLGIKAAGTIRLNRFANPPVVSDKELNTLGRGASYEVTSTDGKVGLIKWLDNKSVTLASNFVTSGSPDIIKRYDKKNKSYVEVCRPEIVKLYNDSMGGVDLHDQLISYYRVFIKSRKWTLRMLFHSFDMATCNSWLEYRNDAEAINLPKKKVMDLLGFKQNLASTLISIGSSVVTPSRKRGRPSSSNKIIVQPKPRTKNRLIDRYPTDVIRKDNIGHYVYIDNLRDATFCKLEGCKKRTHMACKKCNVHLCITKTRNCFFDYHN